MKLTFIANVVGFMIMGGRFHHTYIYNLVDSFGNVFMWSTQKSLNVGMIYQFTAEEVEKNAIGNTTWRRIKRVKYESLD